jgi:hypothetical protein
MAVLPSRTLWVHYIQVGTRRLSKPWLLTWLALMALVTSAAIIAVWRAGLPGLAITGPIVAFATSIPAWFPRVLPEIAVPDADSSGGGDSKASFMTPSAATSVTSTQPESPHSTPREPHLTSLLDPQKTNTAALHYEQRRVGSAKFSDLVYALASAIPDQARIIRIMDLAGLDRGVIEDGFIDASTRWYTALRYAVETGQEEALCHQALRSSPSRALRVAVAAYLS